MSALIKTFLEYLAYQIYHTIIWTITFALIYKWHIADNVTLNLNVSLAVGIVLILKLIAGLNTKLYPKVYDEIQTGYLETIAPYTILLIAFIFKIVLTIWT